MTMAVLRRRERSVLLLAFLASIVSFLIEPCLPFIIAPRGLASAQVKILVNNVELRTDRLEWLLSATTSSSEECSLDSQDANDCLAAAGFEEAASSDSSFMQVTQVFCAPVESLRDHFSSYEDSNVIRFHKRKKRGHHLHCRDDECLDSNTHVANMEYSQVIDETEVVLVDVVRRPGMTGISRAFSRAGPRKYLHFNPSKVNAAIVTCGGLCPGLNNVIRELVHSLYYLYGANTVYGIRGGFQGFLVNDDDENDDDSNENHPSLLEPIVLTNKMVENIHHEGGTILQTSRGGFDIDKILAFLRNYDISQLYVIGGDGTHRGAYAIHQACRDNGLNIAVAGIPKTIDNDVDYIDRSFGFQSAVEAAQASIHTAKTEAMCTVPNGIGVVKIMGRSAGFLAAFASLGSGDVDLVLVPEVPIELEGPRGMLPFLQQRVEEQGYAVVVLAEGAGEELVGVSGEIRDAGGNKELPKIGPFIVDAIQKHFKKHGDGATMKYIDPSYTVRGVPANGADSLYCTQLAQNAVHGAMAGLTGFSVGVVNKNDVYLPIPLLVATSPRSMNPFGTVWERVLAMTGQPNTLPPQGHDGNGEQQQVDQDGELPTLMEPTVH